MNNFQLHKKQMANIQNKPSLLIHICCGVCSVYPLEYLRKYFNITIFFSNSNIYPYDEFKKRLDALKTYLNILNDDSIKLIVDEYNYDSYIKNLAPYKNEPEGSNRCKLCYSLRMDRTFAYANKNNYNYFTTVMSISNRKNAVWINEIGKDLQTKYKNTTYLFADFKKGDGITTNEQMNKKLNLYHQNYCGCEYSKSNR